MKSVFIIILALSLIFIIGCKPEECPVCEKEKCPEVKCPTETTTKYVCSDSRVVDAKEDCEKKTEVKFVPITTNEEGTYINSVKMTSGCYRGENSAVVSFDIGVQADQIRLQVKEDPSEEFKTIYNITGIKSGTWYVVICDTCYSGDVQLKKNKQYLARIEFDLTSLFKTKQYSNEHIIDTRDTSEYITKICSS